MAAARTTMALVALTLIFAAAGLAQTAPKPPSPPRMTLPPPPPPKGQPGNVQWLVQIYLQQQQLQQQQQQKRSPPPVVPEPEPDYPEFDPPAQSSPPPPTKLPSPPPPKSPPPPSPNRFGSPPPSPPPPPPPIAAPSSPPPRAVPTFITYPSPPPPVGVANLEDNSPPPPRKSPPPNPPSPRVLRVLSPPPPPRSGGISWADLPSTLVLTQPPPPPAVSPSPPSPICSPPPPPPMGPIDVWIVAGQSNAVGFNDLDYTPMPMPCGAPMPGQMLMYPMSTHAWVDARTCVGAISCGNPSMSNAVGPDMPFARTLITMGVSSRIGLIPTAVGGTSLSFSWRSPDGPQWQDMVSTVQYAMAAAGPQAKLRGMLWVQGETDGMNYGGAGVYYGNLQKFVWALRNFTQPYHPRLPIVSALMATEKRNLQFPYIGWIRDAQEYANPDTPDIVKVDMEGLEFFDQDMGFGPQWTHLTKKGSCDLGVKMAQAWAASGLQKPN